MAPEEVAATRAALLDVAQALYEAGGDDAMSFRAIASAHGCSSTMPYTYFDSKADIIDGLRVRAYQWMEDALRAAASAAPGPLDALRAIAFGYVRAAAERPRMYQLLHADTGALAETAPELVEAKRRALGVCQRAIETAARSFDVPLRADAETTAHLFWVAAHGLVSLEAGGFLVLGREAEDLLPVLFNAMSVGMVEREKS